MLLPTVTEIVATGLLHTCAVTTDGNLWCWGNNELGQLGNGSAGGKLPTPQRVAICP